MTLPHHIIKEILDYHLNIETNVDYVINFIKKYTLLSKECNSGVIPKLVLVKEIENIHFDQVKELTKLSIKYHWYNFRFRYKYNGGDIDTHVKDRISTLIVEQRLHEFPMDFTHQFRNLKSIECEIKKQDLSPNGFPKWAENQSTSITYQLKTIHTYNDEETLYELTSKSFTRSNLNNRTLNLSWELAKSVSHQFNRLEYIYIFKVAMEKWMFDFIIDHSPLCTRMDLHSITITPLDIHDHVLEKIANSSMVFKCLSINGKNKYTYQSVVEFINKINCDYLILDLENLLNKEISKPIYNNTIKRVSFNDNVSCYLRDWKSKDSIHLLTMVTECNYQEAIKEFKNLERMDFYSNYTSTNSRFQEVIDYTLNLNLPKLKTMSFRNQTQARESHSFKSLYANRYIHTLLVQNILVDEFSRIMDLNHPTLENFELNIDRIKNVKKMTKSIQQNRTITNLMIHSSFADKIGKKPCENKYDIIQIYIDVLSVNRTLVNLKILYLTHMNFLNEKQIDTFQNILKNNSVIMGLELIINKSNDVYYLIGIIRKLTSISSRWNREIIPKLCILSCIEFKSNNHVFSDWVELAERYQLEYQVDLTFIDYDILQYVDSIKDRVESCSIRYENESKKIDKFKNLKRVEVEKFISKGLYFDLKPMENVNCELDLIGFGENYNSYVSFHIDKDSMDLIFNQNIFSVVKVSNNITIDDMVFSIGNTKLTDLEFENMSIRYDTFYHIIEKSKNLKKISLSNIFFNESDSLDCVLDNIVGLTELKDISFKDGRVTYVKLVSFINETKAHNLYFDFRIVEVESYQNVMESIISNNSIQSFYFDKILFHPITKELEDFTLNDIWKTKSSLLELYIVYSIDISTHLRKMEHVQKVTFVNQEEYLETKSIENSFQLNLPTLKQFTLENEICSGDIFPLLLSNSFITTLDLQNAYCDDLIMILNWNHPTLTSLDIRCVLTNEDVFFSLFGFTLVDKNENLKALFESIANNKTVHKLSILELKLYSNQIENYPVKYINQVLFQNNTLLSLIMGSSDYQLDLDNFEYAFTSNTVIQYLGLCVDLESYHKISKICTSHNVIFSLLI
ncbi:hypothetical protein DLAC_04412 [Tieghemostelium lacteum]|uniref:Uncharacterized protein n=1 Tax=Tieghemostelium lacteum TaxID=361077 RepID=A0A151ZJS1_TIELA|nr:hypothetical protein DLAC_04412 [Tieghemostelium lacteum]|eukprot:KYQ94130.1 hypothetical protein DLAC_04412 [Tieghemostelium lacteum]